MKKRIGISIFPEQSSFEEDQKYLDKAWSLGYEVVFTSILHFVGSENEKEKAKKVLRVVKYAKELGFYTIVDVEYKSMDLIGISINDASKCNEYGIDCLRLDSPSLPAEIAFVTHNKAKVDIQLNMSNNDSLIDNVMDFKPIANRLSGCHNFYPLEFTGLPFDYFMECNKRYLKYRLNTSAFIGSHHGVMTSAVGQKELPTIEEIRYLPVSQQAKVLFYTDEIDTVLFGNAYATDEELKELASVDRDEVTFDLKCVEGVTDIEKQVLLFDHYRRGDITEYFIRATQSRVKFKNDDFPARKSKSFYNRGDVVIINNSDKKYKAEIHIILEDNFADKIGKYNYLGTISESEKRLIDFVVPWKQFRFNLV
ncbi:MupG family TIM beta-alpha barrel fold protein [Spiroplasma tabanidicola]|uniref:Outer surface protein n=1 Tax=Spiroplasma tabanidicola TaxID=324079 RepID=A0A6I6C898_9MOLU|nr:MupG family TIM beta-alpha barrel fold protein [Spiroplasma tabanidicola]QGS51659.1 hypothetical protein STABA_v1c02930 [Spiroplasma tabanidicola]